MRKKIRFSLFGSLRDDSKSEKTFNVALAYNGRKTRGKKTNPTEY